jgi:hypothetical protein
MSNLRGCNKRRYPFRDGDGGVVWVDFETMMESSGSYLEMDGKTYRRAYDLEEKPKPKAEKVIERASMLSDSMGFTKGVLANRLEHLKATGIRGVEFKEDRHVPGFYQVQCDNERAKMAYAASLGMSDRNSRNGSSAMLSQDQLDKAKELLLRARP